MSDMLRTRPGPPAAEVGPASFLAAAAALGMMDAAVRTARQAPPDEPGTTGGHNPGAALAALASLRHLREELGSWETALIETARAAGATWADLAAPLGVQSRQAAERRYLRLRPAPVPGTEQEGTGEQRVKATRDRRAGDRAVAAWARDHGGELRRLAAQVGGLTDLGSDAEPAIDRLVDALGAADPAALLEPLAAARPHLDGGHHALAGRVDELAARTDRVRAEVNEQRHRQEPLPGQPPCGAPVR